MNKIIHRWHKKLDMPKKDFKWHKQAVADEFQELEEASGFINRWSEYSDVSYTYTRAHWSGHRSIKLPISYPKYLYGLIYMFPKFSLRWKFFLDVGKKCGADMREVRNPTKVEKLSHIAEKYGVDNIQFITEAKKIMKRRVFLK